MSERDSEHGAFHVTVTLRKGTKGRPRKVQVACEPQVSNGILQELKDALPRKCLLALPFGAYLFRQSSFNGFSVAGQPVGAPEENVSALASAIFPVARRCHAELVLLQADMANLAHADEAIDLIYDGVLQTLILTGRLEMARPGFLKVKVGADDSIFNQVPEAGEDAITRLENGYAFLVVPTSPHEWIALISVGQEGDTFGHVAATLYDAALQRAARVREVPAVRRFQHDLALRIDALKHGLVQLEAAYGPPGTSPRAGDAQYAEELLRSGSIGDA